MIRKSLPFFAATLAWIQVAPTAWAAFDIIPTFDSVILSSSSSAAIQAGINNAIAEFESKITTNITVRISFVNVNDGLGYSDTFFADLAYSKYYADLAVKQTPSANDTIARASLGGVTATNPVNGNANVSLTLPLLRALGEPAGNNGTNFDSVISLNFVTMNFLRTGPQDPNKYDLQDTAAHEIAEVLGAGGAGSALDASGPASPTGAVGSLDLYRYKANHTRSFSTAAATSYFSIDGGATNLSFFNQDGQGDYSDWEGDLNSFHQQQDAFGLPGEKLNMSAAELTALDIVGYNVVPEPSAAVLGGIGLLGTAARRRRREC